LLALENNGLVNVDREAGRRDVWYGLTSAGLELAPALDELTAWGLRHLKRQPHPEEPTHPEHLLTALRVTLERVSSPTKSFAWNVDLTDDRVYSFVFDADVSRWTVSQDAAPESDLTIVTTTRQWSAYLTTPFPDVRATLEPTLTLRGTKAHQTQFRRLLAHFPIGLG
jgi:hypothetical protein